MMRGNDDAVAEEAAALAKMSPLIRPCPIELKEKLKPFGVWKKYLSKKGCYNFIHSTTKEIVAIRPPEYEEDDTKVDNIDDEPDDSPNKEYMQNVIICDDLQDLPDIIHDIVTNQNMTPLILDPSIDPPKRISQFYSYKAILSDVSVLSVGYATSGIKTTDIVEQCRQKLVAALKAGSPMVLDLGGLTSAHANFKQKLCKKDSFPVEVFQKAGKNLFTPKIAPKYEKFFKEEDLEDGHCMVKPDGFQFSVISTLHPKEYKEALKDTLPLGYMKVVYVK